MSRDVQIRDSYQNDAAFLTRLSRAIEKDPKKGLEWKREIIAHLNKVIIMMLSPAGIALPVSGRSVQGKKSLSGKSRNGRKIGMTVGGG